jgi:hypothetical protein
MEATNPSEATAARYRNWVTCAATAALLAVAAAPGYHFTRPRVRCCLPERDYQFGRFSPPLFAMSQSAVNLPLPAPGEGVQLPARLYQFDVAQLKIDHCSISQMAVEIQQNGHWILNLQADQNPLAPRSSEVVPNVTTEGDASKYTAQQRRNAFHVALRCYRAGGDSAVPLGKPLAIELKPDPFWVQRGQPYRLMASGTDKSLGDFFGAIDRVEIEFYYRRPNFEQSLLPGP